MANPSDFPAVGMILSADDASVTFKPKNTSYELKLLTSSRYDGPNGKRVEGVIRVQARKVYTVPSGGNFIVPIYGPPRIVQGRIRYLDDRAMVVQAGLPVVVELPAAEDAYDLVNGPLAVGALVNVPGLPGATIEIIHHPAAVGSARA